MGGVSLETATLGLGAVLAATMVVALVARVWLRSGGEPFPGDANLYEMAFVAGGPTRVSDTALSYLVWSGAVEVRETTGRLVRIVGPGAVPNLHPVELSVLSAIDPVGVRPDLPMGTGREAARQFVRQPPGLLVPAWRSLLVDVVVLGGSALVAALAIWWMLSSKVAGSGFVPLFGLLAGVVGTWWMVAGRPRLTRAGMDAVENWKTRSDPDLQIAAIGVTSLPMERAMPVVALYGRDALTGGLSGLRTVITGSPASMHGARSLLSR